MGVWTEPLHVLCIFTDSTPHGGCPSQWLRVSQRGVIFPCIDVHRQRINHHHLRILLAVPIRQLKEFNLALSFLWTRWIGAPPALRVYDVVLSPRDSWNQQSIPRTSVGIWLDILMPRSICIVHRRLPHIRFWHWHLEFPVNCKAVLTLMQEISVACVRTVAPQGATHCLSLISFQECQ